MSNLSWPAMARDVDTLGEVQKKYESMVLESFMPGIPVIARLDGKAFHTFTKNLKKPFDLDLQMCMKNTLIALCEKFQVDVGYSQSDEITLVWYNTRPEKMVYNGRSAKFMSLLASTCSVEFYKNVIQYLPQKIEDTPVFDCRVFQVESAQRAFENVLWRWLDARKNSVNMLASAHFSAKALLNVSTKVRRNMLEARGIMWDELHDDCKVGYFCKRQVWLKEVTAEFKENVTDPIVRDGKTYVPRKRYGIVANMPSLHTLVSKAPFDDDAYAQFKLKLHKLETVFSECNLPFWM